MIDLAGLPVRAISIGGLETCIEIPEYKLAFDIGRCPSSVITRPTVLFTHAHMDHMGGVAAHAATRKMRGMPAPVYVVPPDYAEDFAKLFEVWRRLDGSEMPCSIIPLAPGEEYALNSRLYARPFRSPHRQRCQGYGIWSTKHKLRAEFAGRSPAELKRLRVEEGVSINERVEVPEIVFTGDTRIEVVEREEVVRKARRLVIEATFLDDRVSIERCRETGHVHLDEIAERADLFENEVILLTHFSARYKRDEILRLLDEKLPPGLRERVVPLLGGHS